MDRVFLKWAIAVVLVFSSLTVRGGSISRSADFSASTSFNSGGSIHGGLGAPDAERWRYRLLPEWSEVTLDFGWNKVLASDGTVDFNQSEPFLFEKRLMGLVQETGKLYFERYRYTVDADHFYLCWNKNDPNPTPDCKAAALVVEFTPPRSGRYSLSGVLKWASTRADDMKQAWYVVGKAHGDGFSELFRHEFVAENRFEEPVVFADLAALEVLQNIKLSTGDRLVFIVAGSRFNYRGLEVYDSELTISSPELPEVDAAILPLQQAMALVDLDRPGLDGVRKLWLAGDIEGAFEGYKRILVKRVASFKSIKNFYYWLHAPADADELLQGRLTTGHYGRPTQTTAQIGLPGQVQWYRVPEDGYTTLLRDISTMQWATKLAEKYQQTGEVKYLEGWMGYWDDFASNWPREYRMARANPEVMKQVEKDSIAWCDGILYIAWRIEAFCQGLNAVCHVAMEQGQVDRVDNAELARLLIHVVTFEAARGAKWINRNIGVPNQRVHCGQSMFELGICLNDFKGAEQWRQMGIGEVLRSGFLPDGSDMEQSLNYNALLPKTIWNFLDQATNIPRSERGAWAKKLAGMFKYRYYFLHSIANPDGAQPSVGNNNTWRDYGKPARLMPGLSPADTQSLDGIEHLPLSRQIREYVYEHKAVAPPAFNSIYFPYGGFVVQRDGWDPESLYGFMKTSRAGKGHMREGGNGVVFSAYGQNLIVNSGGEMYDPVAKIKGYWHSTVAHNSISVDGYGQDLRHGAEIPVTYSEPIDARYLCGKRFDFAEGKFRGGYSGWNFLKHGTAAPVLDKIPHDPVIEGVSHDRQLIFLKKEKMWIVTDRVESKSEHRFSQSWLFAPEYTPDMLATTNNMISTHWKDGVNICLYQCGSMDLDYSSNYGTMEKNQLLGWVAKKTGEGSEDFTPAVNVLVDWVGSGKQVLVTVVVPYENSNPVESMTAAGPGFDMILADGQRISYRYHGSGKVEAELTSGNSRLILSAGKVIEVDEDGGRIGGKVPRMFKWKTTPDGEIPIYW